MRVALFEIFRTQRYIRYKAEVERDDGKIIITFLDVPTHFEGRQYFKEFMQLLNIPVQFVEQENNSQ